MYRLVAYHKFKVERESLSLGRSCQSLEKEAERQDVEKYKEHELVIENYKGETVSTFRIQNDCFKKVG